MTTTWLLTALALFMLVILPRASRWLWLRPFALDHKVVVITGGASGIGRGLAQRIWRTAQDVTLVLLDVNDDGLRDIKTQLLEETRAKFSPPSTSSVLTFHCDVSDDVAVGKCIAQVVVAVAPRHISVLVNNAGIVNGCDISELTPSQLQRVFGVNVFAHFYLVKHALPSMKKSDGGALIVSVSSLVRFHFSSLLFGLMFGCKLADYCAAKAAVISFHNCLRLELLRDGLSNQIRTLLVCPLGVDTGMFTGIFESDRGFFDLQRHLAPILTQDQAVTRIHSAMVRGEHQVVSCHPGVQGAILEWTVPLQRLLPMPIHDWLARASGTVRGMDSFVGRQPQPQPSATTN